MRNSYYTELGIDGIIALLEFPLLFLAYSPFRQEPSQTLKPSVAPILALIALLTSYFCAESRPANPHMFETAYIFSQIHLDWTLEGGIKTMRSPMH